MGNCADGVGSTPDSLSHNYGTIYNAVQFVTVVLAEPGLELHY